VTEPGGPGRRGRHSSADDGAAGLPTAHWSLGSDAPPGGAFDRSGFATGGFPPVDRGAPLGRPTGGYRPVSGLLDRFPDATGPVAEPAWWSYGSSDHPDHPLSARHSGEDRGWDRGGDGAPTGDPSQGNVHPSAPLPPMPPGVWDRLHPRGDDEAATVAHRRVPGRPAGHAAPEDPHEYDEAYDEPSRIFGHEDDEAVHYAPEDDHTDAHRLDSVWEDQTGGLDVIGANVDEDAPRRRRRRRDRHAADHFAHAHDHDHDELDDDEIPIAPYDPRSGRRRRRRRPLAVLISLIVLGGLVAGIVIGGEKLLTLIDPSSRDFTGQGTGTVEIRITQGDTLSDIARTLVNGGVIASIGPFIDAAEADPAATGIQPGVYQMREQMSGQAAVDRLLDPAARLVSRVTLPEGLTVKATLAKLSETTGTPIEELTAAAADPAALGLPDYAGGNVEGFLFPATYDFEPDTTAADMLQQMVARAVHALDELQIPVDQRLTVVTKASLVQAEASTSEDMAKVARVLENRLADGMPLQLDTTVNYANDKGGITTSATDRDNPSPYNTYVHPGLPPGAITNPGEEALRAVLAPADGDWRFFVVVDPDTGETRFAVTGEEHQQNVLLFQQWLREHPGN
jgi:UPF0755 protein